MRPAPTVREWSYGPVTIRRDKCGIPEVVASGWDDVSYGQGLVTALDRSWQLEMLRRRSASTVAEVVGDSGVAWDALAAKTYLEQTAKGCYTRLDQTTRRWVDRFVHGINDALNSFDCTGVEFEVTRLRPQPWQPWQPIAAFMVHNLLPSGFGEKLARSRIADTLGPEALGWWSDSETLSTAGSNAWVIPGRQTLSGLPIIAGDPHRRIDAPGVYQQIRLNNGHTTFAGAAMPGVPGVAHFAQNDSVAWAITHAMADEHDLFDQQIRRTPTGYQALGTNGWFDIIVQRRPIVIRGGSTSVVLCAETDCGVVISDDLDALDIGARTTSTVLGWPAQVTKRCSMQASRKLLDARCVDDVAASLEQWVEPVNRVISADISGRAVELVAGLVPLRPAQNAAVTVPAADGHYRWRGWRTLPAARDIDDVTVHANQAYDDDGIGGHHPSGYRAQRLHDVLTTLDAVSAGDMLTCHIDTHQRLSGFYQRLMSVDTAADDAESFQDMLASWDGQTTRDSVEALWFSRCRHLATHHLAQHPLFTGYVAAGDKCEVAAVRAYLNPVMRLGMALDTFLGSSRSPLSVSEQNSLCADVLHDASRMWQRGSPMSEQQWPEWWAPDPDVTKNPATWGDCHRLYPHHDLDSYEKWQSHTDVSAMWSATSLPVAGDSECVLSTSSTPGVHDWAWRGPVFRYVWDLSDQRFSSWVVPFGASGDVHSPHHHDQLQLWMNGKTVPVKTFDYEQFIGYVGEKPVTARAVRPDDDLDLLYDWTRGERAQFWGMTEYQRDDVRDIYRFIDDQHSHHAYLIFVAGEAAMLFQTYDPAHDPIGKAYDRLTGDIGIHLMMAPTIRRTPGFSLQLGVTMLRWVLGDATISRVVAEPDANNVKAHDKLAHFGFTPSGDAVDLGHKQAKFHFLTRNEAIRHGLISPVGEHSAIPAAAKKGQP